MTSEDSLIHSFQRALVLGQESPDLRLPPLPDTWKIDLAIEGLGALTLYREGARFMLRSIDEPQPDSVRVELSAITLRSILDDEVTPTRALANGDLSIHGPVLGHFTDPSLSVLFQLLRCGIGRRLPSRGKQKTSGKENP